MVFRNYNLFKTKSNSLTNLAASSFEKTIGGLILTILCSGPLTLSRIWLSYLYQQFLEFFSHPGGGIFFGFLEAAGNLLSLPIFVKGQEAVPADVIG